MPISVAAAQAELTSLLQDLVAEISQQIAGNIPLLGSLAMPAGGLLLDELDALISDALATVSDTPDAIAAALDGLDFVTATLNGDDLDITISTEDAIELLDEDFDIGAGIGPVGLNLSGTFATNLVASLDLALKLEGATGQLKIVDNGTEELSLTLAADLSLNNSGAKLGFIDITATDKDPAQHEAELTLAVDLQAGDAGGLAGAAIDPVLSGRAGLNLDIKTVVADGLLPGISANLVFEFPSFNSADPAAIAAPEIAFNDITIDIGSFFGVFGDVLVEISNILKTEPLGTIIDIITGPMPVIDDLAHKAGVAGFIDSLPPSPFPKDNVVSLADIAYLKSQFEGSDGAKFFEAISFIAFMKNLGDSIAETGGINLGDLSLSGLAGGAPVTPADLLARFQGIAGSGALGALTDFVKDTGILDAFSDAIAENFSQEAGLKIPILDDPSLIIKLLFDQNNPVDLVTFDLPELKLDAGVDAFFPLLGPLGVSFTGLLHANVDMIVGYDSSVLSSGKFEDGLYFTTAANTKPIDPRLNPYGRDALAHLDAEIAAGAGLSAFAISALIKGGFDYNMDAFLINEKTRLADLDTCFLDLFGKATADIRVEIEVGFDPFSYTKKFPLASTVLADFDAFDCPPYKFGVTSPAGKGLATLGALGVPTELVLNVGPRAGERVINGDNGTPVTGTDTGEFYEIRLARDPAAPVAFPAIAQPGPLVPGALDVSAMGFTQRYGSATDTITTIRGDFGNEDDSLVVSQEITLDVRVSGGAGSDFLAGGSGRNFLNGDGGADYLSGGRSADVLNGGADDDTLDGRDGADTLNGGSGRDTVTYENSNLSTGQGVQIFVSNGVLFAFGGEATGDSLDSIEHIVGTRFNDDISADPTPNNPAEGSTLEGLEGNDILRGADNKDDYILGGPGADAMYGGGGKDGTSYLTSWSGVHVDLARGVYKYGDAQGDWLVSIESVQGSGFKDTIFGDNGDNVIDGFLGDDRVSGGGGKDIVFGGQGNDIVFAFGDGDKLDGGGLLNDPGRDLLTYRSKTDGAVTVSLKTTDVAQPGAGGDIVVGASVFVSLPVGGQVLTPISGYSTFEDLEGTDLATVGDNLTGDAGYNTIRGLAGNDTINGDDGNDTISGGKGADALIGGNGIDLADYSASREAVNVNLATGTGSGGDAEGDTLATIENLRGSDRTDILTGDNLDNVIDPGLGDTNLIELVYGGGGTDTLVIDYSRGDIGRGVVGGYAPGSNTSGGFERGAALSGATLDSVAFEGIERIVVIGTIRADNIVGAAGDDIIVTGSGDDIVDSGLGADIVLADRGDDIVTYGTNAEGLSDRGGDVVFYLSGGAGIDTLTVSLSKATNNITLIGSPEGQENPNTNVVLTNGAAIEQFEIFKDVFTGSGNDILRQDGFVDNTFFTGDGNDIITPGLGTDNVDGGRDTGGLSLQEGFAGHQWGTIEDRTAFHSGSDKLVLDYSSLSDGNSVTSFTHRISTAIDIIIRDGDEEMFTNYGFYESRISEPGQTAVDRVDFNGIEQLDVTGSSGNDTLYGTFVAFSINVLRNIDDVYSDLRGDDVLRGGGGDDVLLGLTGSDELFGGDGGDWLYGTNQIDGDDSLSGLIGNDLLNISDSTEVDILTGGTGADTFVLGVRSGAFYDNAAGSHAEITDFKPVTEGDRIQLYGVAADWTLTETGGNTEIAFANSGKVVAVVQGVTGLDLNGPAFTYVDFNSPLPVLSFAPPVAPFAAPIAEFALAAPADPDPAALAGPAFAPLAAAGGFTVTQNNDETALLAALGTASGISGATLTVEGNAEAFGTFDGDPFGLGSGIILSTGRVEDLVGPNTSNGTEAPAQSVSLTFEKLGRVGNTDVLVADLSNLGINIQSLTLQDLNNLFGGGGGEVSGFDLDAIVLSHTLLTPAELTSIGVLNDETVLPRIDAFDFDAAHIFFKPGTQRDGPPTGFTNRETLSGWTNQTLIDPSSTLSVFDSTLSTLDGAATIGNGGIVGFNLNQTVQSNGPLYLYIGEGGGSGESVRGQLSVSSSKIEPSGDLSSDLGLTGTEGDTSTLTYTFTAATGADTLEFDIVIFSEELPEFGGSELIDSLRITINGDAIGSLSDGRDISLNSLMVTSYGPIHPDLILNPPVTGPHADIVRADAYTTVIHVKGGIVGGAENVLQIEVADERDGFLDTGILIKGDSFRAYDAPDIRVFGGAEGGGGGTLIEGGPDGTLVIDFPPGTIIPEGGIDVKTKPSPGIDTGNGGGNETILHIPEGPVPPGGYEFPVKAIPTEGPPAPGRVDLEVITEGFTGLPIPPVGFNVEEPPNVPPVITSGDTFVLPENTVQVVTVTATDTGPPGPLVYSKTGGTDASRFAIDPLTGALTFLAPPDFESPRDTDGDNVYEVIVRATDSGGLYDEQTITVTVTDANDAPTGIGVLPMLFVQENAKAGTPVADLTAFDPDPQTTFTFSIESDPSGFFTIVGNRLQVAAGAKIDFENSPTHTILVKATDQGGLSVTQTFTISVGDVSPEILLGTPSANTIMGGSDRDFIFAFGGNDTLFGNGGNDLLRGEGGGDKLYGGDGDDTLEGGFGADKLYGGSGNDKMFGGYGDDVLSGGAGNDRIDGSRGADRIRGGDGDDIIAGGRGRDTLIGDAGADRFDFRADYVKFGALEIDTIVGFEPGDLINLRAIDANLNVTGNQKFAFIGQDAFGSHAGELRAFSNGQITLVQGDVDGDGTADFAIRLVNLKAAALSASDFLL